MDVSLVMFREDGQQREFALEPGQTTIGRKEDCDLRIPLAEISRKHAIVIITDKAVTMRDLGSANGTYVNNKRISEQELAAGDHIVVGPVVFTIRINGEPSDVRRVHTRLEARTPAQAGAGRDHREDEESGVISADDIFGPVDDDPISALEEMASTGDTATIDLSDSFARDFEDDDQKK